MASSSRPTAPRVVRVYAPPGWRLTRQLLGDAFLVVWTLGWALVAVAVKRLVDALAVPSQTMVSTAREISTTTASAGDSVSKVPGVGGTLATPFRALQQQVTDLAGAAQHQADVIHQVAWTISLISVAIPVLLACWLWLPRRVRFIREAAAARRFIDSDADLDLFALRAMTHLPMATLAGVSDDPVTAWRDGDREVIERLAALELHRSGLTMPRRDKPPATT